MLNIVFCDDDNNATKRYSKLISQIAKKHQIQISLSCFCSGEAFLFHLSDKPKEVDIIYLDIMMDKTNGMQIARKLRDCGVRAQIIFLTSYDEYVFEAFDVNAAQYLIKEETSIEKFEKVFLRTVELASKQENELFTYEFDRKTIVIPIYQISYFEIWKRIVTVHYGVGETAKFYASMEVLESKLSEKNFVRTHRSYLVHLPYISMFQKQNLQLKTGEMIPVGVTYMKSLKKTFSDYISCFHIYHEDSLEEKEEKQ